MCLKEFGATLRMADALRAVLDGVDLADAGVGRADALLTRLLGADQASSSVGAPAMPASVPDGPQVPQPCVDLAGRALEALPVLVIATVPYQGRDQVGVAGLTADGRQRVVLFHAGSTADPVATDNLCLHHGQRSVSPYLCVTAGGGALDREIADPFRACLVAHADPYVERAVLSHLADGPAQAVRARLRGAVGHTGREAEAALRAILADLRGRAPGTYQTPSHHMEGVLALGRPGMPRRLERSLSRGAMVATCAQETRALGRRHAPAGEDPLLDGAAASEAATRRLIGHEHLLAPVARLLARPRSGASANQQTKGRRSPVPPPHPGGAVVFCATPVCATDDGRKGDPGRVPTSGALARGRVSERSLDPPGTDRARRHGGVLRRCGPCSLRRGA